MAQPVVTGIQAVGAVDIYYMYNAATLPAPSGWTGALPIQMPTSGDGLIVTGFRLDSEFLRAAQQIASSTQIPILGGGAIALTNNNRSGSLTINCTKVSTPVITAGGNMEMTPSVNHSVGVVTAGNDKAYDLVLLAQYQQGTSGGDSVGATLTVRYSFNGKSTTLKFQGVTVAEVAPVVLAGNDAANYSVTLNYLNWVCEFSNV